MSLKVGCTLSDIRHTSSMPLKDENANEFLRRFGLRLKEIRLARKFTQEELAALAGFSRSYYTQIESGKRNISLLNLRRLAICLDIRLKELVDIEEHA